MLLNLVPTVPGSEASGAGSEGSTEPNIEMPKTLALRSPHFSRSRFPRFISDLLHTFYKIHSRFCKPPNTPLAVPLRTVQTTLMNLIFPRDRPGGETIRMLQVRDKKVLETGRKSYGIPPHGSFKGRYRVRRIHPSRDHVRRRHKLKHQERGQETGLGGITPKNQ